MKKEYHHFAFGLFIEEVLKCEKVGISAMCQAIGMSKGTYEMHKKRDDKCLNYYERIFNYYYDTLTEEEFLRKASGHGGISGIGRDRRKKKNPHGNSRINNGLFGY